ncbi:hypothetical protein FB451DRAFT_337112 [Mycena latifolia]|nr:hypothetical protein FB451DRAFT_337112 [Mycena latifolia]
MPSPGHLVLVTSLVSSSYFTFANIGGACFGVLPATARGNTTLPVADRLALWNFSYEVGKVGCRDWACNQTESKYTIFKKHMAGSNLISAISLSASAYLTSERSLRNVLAAGAVAAYTMAAFTIFFMLPVNKNLISMLRSSSLKPMEPWEQQHVLDQLDKWRALHRVRIVLGVIPWLASTTAVLLSDSILRFIFPA